MPETEEHRRERFARQKAGYDLARETMRAKMLAQSIGLARTHGYQWITRQMVADALGISAASVNNYYGQMIELKRAVLRWGVANGDAQLIAQGLANDSPITADIEPELRAKAAQFIAAL